MKKNTRLDPPIYSSGYYELNGIKKYLVDFFNNNKCSGTILDIGAQYKPYYPIYERYFENIIIQDYVDVSGVDICCDAKSIPLDSNSIDLCLLTQVLEHTKDFQDVINECYRVLKPGGFILITVPSMFPIHGYPHDCWRFMPDGLEHSLSKFSEVEITPLMSFFQCWLVSNQYFLFNLYEKLFVSSKVSSSLKTITSLFINTFLKILAPIENLVTKEGFKAFQISIGACAKKNEF